MPKSLTPAIKLSNEQLRFLAWLSKAKTNFEICRAVGLVEAKYNGLFSYVNDAGNRLKFDIRTLYRLLNEKLVTSKRIYHFGLVWEQFTVTELGKEFLLLQLKAKG